ncbi:hypothetical protein I4U23_028576 [Adineta vaga]|nr:hypothetical protein I4U23_028576 [Adineta vaga]
MMKSTNDERNQNYNTSRTNLFVSPHSTDPDEEITRVLTTENTYGPKNLVMFSYRRYNSFYSINYYKKINFMSEQDKQFVPVVNTEQLVIHYSYEGNLIPIDSDEAKVYLQKENNQVTSLLPIALLNTYKNEKLIKIEIKPSNEHDELPQQAIDEDELHTVASDISEQSELNEFVDDLTPTSQVQSPISTEKPKKILNRFNYCEQGIQTYSSPSKNVTTLTDPIPNKKFVGLANQRILYQEYAADYAKQEKDKEKRKHKTSYGPSKGIFEKKMIKTERLKPEAVVKRRQVRVLKAIERVLNQNRYHEMIYNFKYFEDKTDEIRDPMGTLFPLWKFSSTVPNRSVTALTWNPTYSDMLIIGYGLYDRAERIQGAIAVFTLNNSHPDTLIHTESTVLSIDCLPSRPYLICVGLMDGDVIVYDISFSSCKTVFTNPSYTCKHLGCVWQVQWCLSSNDHQPRFCSVGDDGKVIRWTCIKGELRRVLLLDLPSTTKSTRLDDGTLLSMPGPALALDFHRHQKDVFIVGTEDGKIYKASIDDPGMIDMIFNAHDFAVYSVQWSPFHPNVFASCSADGTVKIWHEKLLEYLMRFDLCTSLQDIVWSPFTSTLFATAGTDGKVYIFDIHSNKLEPICEQLLADELGKSCTKIAFNPIHPILLAGDETGLTICLKLSPNLRKKAKMRKGVEYPANYEPEFHKLAQELARTVAGDTIQDILHVQTIENED